MFALLDTLPGLSVVSVGHRPSLVPFHDTKLVLASKGFKLESTGSNRKRGHETGAPASANVAVADATDS